MSPIDEGFKNRILREDVNTRQVAHFIVMAHEGIYGMLKGLDNEKVFDSLYQTLKNYFKTLAA